MDKFGEDFAAEFVKMDEQLLRRRRYRAWIWTVAIAALTGLLFAVTEPPTKLWQWAVRPLGFLIMLAWTIQIEREWRRARKAIGGV